jgi:hypothetical protein
MESTPGSPLSRLRVLTAQVTPLPRGQRGGFQILVFAEGLLQRAVPVVARVGDQPVESLHQSPGGFSGVLERRPSPGDRLHVGYLDIGPLPTQVVFRGTDVT